MHTVHTYINVQERNAWADISESFYNDWVVLYEEVNLLFTFCLLNVFGSLFWQSMPVMCNISNMNLQAKVFLKSCQLYPHCICVFLCVFLGVFAIRDPPAPVPIRYQAYFWRIYEPWKFQQVVPSWEGIGQHLQGDQRSHEFDKAWQGVDERAWEVSAWFASLHLGSIFVLFWILNP